MRADDIHQAIQDTGLREIKSITALSKLAGALGCSYGDLVVEIARQGVVFETKKTDGSEEKNMAKQLTEEDKQELVEMKKQGMSMSGIVIKTGRAWGTVKAALDEAGQGGTYGEQLEKRKAANRVRSTADRARRKAAIVDPVFDAVVDETATKNNVVDPPMPAGIRPCFLVDSERAQEITGAIARYSQANLITPLDWVQELDEILFRVAQLLPAKENTSA